MKKLLLVGMTVLLAACQAPTPTPNLSPSPVESPTVVPTASSSPATCLPTDQDNDIYHPDRLSVQAACIRVTGEILAKVQEADGDFHIRVLLDPQFTNLLQPNNSQQCANNDAGVRTCNLLVVEPVCVNPVSQADAILTCQADKDPLASLPNIHDHVWMEGRYVFDLGHGGWAELHPLYRWGLV